MSPRRYRLAPAVRRQLRRSLMVEEDVLGILASQPLDVPPQAPDTGRWTAGFHLPLPVLRNDQFLALAWTEAVLEVTEDGDLLVVELRVQPLGEAADPQG